MTTHDETPAGFAPPALPAAIELLTAMQGSQGDASFFWNAVQRVMADGTDADDPGQALAELVFGLTSLSQIMLRHLAEAGGSTEEFLLGRLATVYRGQKSA